MTVPLTLLTITPLYGAVGELTPYSARGLTQSLDLIMGNAIGNQIHRTINGGLLDLTYDQFRKYKSVISCGDHTAPAFDGLKQGTIVQVDCCIELSYKTAGGSPSRTVVSSRTEGDYTFYLPRLTMMVTDFKPGSFAEWEARHQWSLELEEI